MEPPFVLKRVSWNNFQISALHRKKVEESELQCFKKASAAGLTPTFRGCTKLQADLTKSYYLYCDVWDFDLDGTWSLAAWPAAHKQALADAVHKLPKMLDQLHSLEMYHGDIFSRNIVLRQVCPPDRPDLKPEFEIAFIDFGHSGTIEEQRFVGNDRFIKLQEQDRAQLSTIMHRMGELLDQTVSNSL